MVASAVRQQNVVESRKGERACFVCVDRNTYVPTFLLGKGRKERSGDAYDTMRSRILHGHPRVCSNERTIRL